eukprot:4093472-Ditylum_brightwellii.AAC.1
MKACHHLLDFVATHPNVTVRYLASDMMLVVHSDASYLSERLAHNRAARHFYLANKTNKDLNNSSILTLSTIIHHVVASASEAELAALFYNAQEAVPLCTTLEEMGQPHPKTPLVTDNSTAHGLTQGTMSTKRSKAMDMRFHWLKDLQCQGQFDILWQRGTANKADYPSKHHPPK